MQRDLGVRFAAALALVLAAPILAYADTIPLCGPICFHSSDPSPVSVKLIHELQPDRTTELRIPRSAIVFVGEYGPSQYKRVPDEITSRGWLDLAIVAPHGEPIGEAVEAYAERERVSLGAAATALRPFYAMVRVRVVGKGISNSRLYSAWIPRESETSKVVDWEPFDDLPAQTIEPLDPKPGMPNSASISYFPADARDPFAVIKCERLPQAMHWCEYNLRLNDLISLEVRMVDFRLNGGRAFVRDRMNMVVRTYCSYTTACQ